MSVRRQTLLCLLLAAALFALDSALPGGVGNGLGYVAIVVLALVTGRRRDVVFAAALGSLLTLIGLLVFADAEVTSVVVVNRLLTVAVLWVIALLGLRRYQILRTRERLLREQMAVLVSLMHSERVGKGERGAARDRDRSRAHDEDRVGERLAFQRRPQQALLHRPLRTEH